MYSKELDRIEGKNREVLEKHLKNYPIKVGEIAKELGVAIKVSSMQPGNSGQIRKEGDGYVVRVNRHEARERQRFTIGHELAHFLLHKHVIDSSPDGITDNVLYRSGAPERIEYEANRLAADILMPANLIANLLDDEFGGLVTDATIESMASRFKVSKSAMEIRLSTIDRN